MKVIKKLPVKALVAPIICLAVMAATLPCSAQDKEEIKINVKGKKLKQLKVKELEEVKYSDEFLDTVQVSKGGSINDYTMLGVHYGVGLNRMSWNPRMRQTDQFNPMTVGVTWTRYGKLFGYMSFFGIQAGAYYTREGYSLEEPYQIQGAQNVTMEVVEVPVLAHFHYDIWKFKILAALGFYGSYRLSIHREGISVLPSVTDTFLATDHRFDYGIKGGAGFGLIFDPIEIHFMAMYKYGLGNLYDPDYYSQYYYRFATVSNFVFTVGLHFQLTKREGKTNRQLKLEARELYGKSPKK